MAIKTKKISELDVLTVDTPLVDGGIEFLCTKTSGVTGKLSSKTIFDSVKTIVIDECDKLKEELQKPSDTPVTASLVESPEIDAIKSSVGTLSKGLEDLTIKHKNFTNNQHNKNNRYEEQIASLEEKVTALESFIHKLQKDGYLTLAEIRKAAAETCPICTHTHEEVTETPAE